MVSGPTLRPEGVDHSPSRTTPKEPFPSFPHSISCFWLMRQVSDCSPLWREEGEDLPPSSAILLAVPERICKRLTPSVILISVQLSSGGVIWVNYNWDKFQWMKAWKDGPLVCWRCHIKKKKFMMIFLFCDMHLLEVHVNKIHVVWIHFLSIYHLLLLVTGYL